MNPLVRIASIPLRAKLGAAIVLGIVVALALGLFAFNEFNDASQPASGVVVQSLVQDRADAMSSTLSRLSSTVAQLAREPLMMNAYASLASKGGDTAAVQSVTTEFRDALNLEPTFRQIRFVAPNGDVRLSVPALGGLSDTSQPYFTALQNRPPAISSQDVYFGPVQGTVDLTIDAAAVVGRLSGQPIGYLVVSIDPIGSSGATNSGLFDALRVISPTTGNVTFYLVNAAGGVISPIIRPIPSNDQRKATGIQLATQADGLPTDYSSPLTGLPVIGSSLPLTQLKLALVGETRLIEFAGSNEGGLFAGRLLILLGAAMVLFVLLAVFLGVTIWRPTRSLLALTSAAAQGRPLTNVRPVTQRDEIGQLYTAFDALNGQLRQDIQNLESRVSERTRDLEATREVIQIISSIRDLDTLLRQVVGLIRERFPDVYHAQIFLLDPTGLYAVLRVSTGEAGRQLLARGHRLAVGSQSVIGQVTARDEPVVALDTATSTVHKVNELLPDTRAELALPLRTADGVIGALDLQSTHVDAFTEADVELFQTVANQLSIAITTVRVIEESQSRLTEIEELNRRLIGEAWRGYGRRKAAASTADDTNGHEGWSSLQTQAVQTGQLVEHVDGDTVTIAMPIILRGESLGAIEMDLPRLAYNDNMQQLAVELTAQLAVSADNARLFEQSQRVAERERLVSEIASKLTEQTDVTQILRIAVREVGLALQVPQTTIRLALDHDQDRA